MSLPALAELPELTDRIPRFIDRNFTQPLPYTVIIAPRDPEKIRRLPGSDLLVEYHQAREQRRKLEPIAAYLRREGIAYTVYTDTHVIEATGMDSAQVTECFNIPQVQRIIYLD